MYGDIDAVLWAALEKQSVVLDAMEAKLDRPPRTRWQKLRNRIRWAVERRLIRWFFQPIHDWTKRHGAWDSEEW